MPSRVPTCSAAMSPCDAERQADPQSHQHAGQRGREDGLGDQAPAGESESAGGLDHLAVHVADAEVRVGVHRCHRRDRDEDDLERLVDPEPRDEQRHQREEGDGPVDLHRRIDELLTERRQPRQNPEHQADDGAEEDTDRGPLQRREREVDQLAGGVQLRERVPHLDRRGQHGLGDQAGGGSDPPPCDQHRGHQKTQRQRQPRGSAALPAVRGGLELEPRRRARASRVLQRRGHRQAPGFDATAPCRSNVRSAAVSCRWMTPFR